ncbi:VOC family protein [Alsobacter metallidurans]|uniref:VOC family protein n=1 Tax=Alsobacter metallidurans TaxID=340221 RepID=A0A917IB26_9HYPH|nr:VOC family protein [Alsobacter metallidurans]GGH28051.1 VOC family protein [Alsobacter metallidurans]
MTELSHCLWFNGQAEEAARWYCSAFPNSRMGAVITTPVDTPAVKQGGVLLVEFTLAGQPYAALNGGPNFSFTPAVSLVLSCDGQDEVDRVWNAILDGGGQPMACGWITDGYGVSWQVVPAEAFTMLKDPDDAKRRRYMQAMMDMVKLDLPTLRRAFDGAAD